MENYRQLPAKMHLISMRLASSLLTQLTTCLFTTDISPVCSLLSGFKFAYQSPAFSTYVVLKHIQRIQEISVLQNTRLFFKRNKPSHFPPKKRGLPQRLSVTFHNGLHRGADVSTYVRTHVRLYVRRTDSDVITKIFRIHGFTKISYQWGSGARSSAKKGEKK